jgi:bifunctional aspartokinase / homoserine dehydrogenase 1
VNVRAIAQGASERNISAVIPSEDADRALRAVHAAFYLSPQAVSIGLVGPGGVGGHLLDQLAAEIGRASRRSRGSTCGCAPWPARAACCWRRAPCRWIAGARRWPRRADRFRRLHGARPGRAPAARGDHRLQRQPEVAARYADWLARGIHVITPSKLAASGPLAEWRRINEARRAAGVRYLGETTVGAGLPIIQTLRDLRQTGDEIIAIEGILSGTLAFLFNGYDGSGRSPRSCARRARWASPSRTRATTCRARTWRASW